MTFASDAIYNSAIAQEVSTAEYGSTEPYLSVAQYLFRVSSVILWIGTSRADMIGASNFKWLPKSDFFSRY